MKKARIFSIISGVFSSAMTTGLPAQSPNFIVIVADDMGWGDLGCYPKGEAWGEEAYTPTPCIDALARSGIRCTQAYATCM